MDIDGTSSNRGVKVVFTFLLVAFSYLSNFVLILSLLISIFQFAVSSVSKDNFRC